MFYLESEKLPELYNKIFNETKDFLSDEEIDNLSLEMRLDEALNELSENKLAEFAKDNDVRLCEDREKQEKLIIQELLER